MYILLAQRRHIILEKYFFFVELTVYDQVYLFIIIYLYWIATNIVQYLLYNVVLTKMFIFEPHYDFEM